MELEQPNPRPALASYDDVARMLDFAVLDPALPEERLAHACEIARRYRPGRFTVRPSDLDLVSEWMKGSGIPVGSAVAFPHGVDTTAVKLYALRDALARGARFILSPIHTGKLASRQFRYLESELMQMSQECRRGNAELILQLDVAALPEDLRVIACRIARRAEVSWIRAAASLDDLRFLAARLGDLVQLDAGPAPAAIEELQLAYEAGASAFQTTDPAPLLEAWSAELKIRQNSANVGRDSSRARL